MNCGTMVAWAGAGATRGVSAEAWKTRGAVATFAAKAEDLLCLRRRMVAADWRRSRAVMPRLARHLRRAARLVFRGMTASPS